MRLTNDVRDGIAYTAISQSFATRVAAFDAAEDALAKEAYNSLFPVAEQKLVAKVPTNWFRLDACLRFNVGGQRIELTVAGDGLPVPYKPRGSTDRGYHCNTLGAIPAGDLCDRIQAHAMAKDNFRTERRQAETAVKAMLNSVTTIGKLKEVWPEGAPFYAQIESATVISLPAIRASEVNAMLGLQIAA